VGKKKGREGGGGKKEEKKRLYASFSFTFLFGDMIGRFITQRIMEVVKGGKGRKKKKGKIRFSICFTCFISTNRPSMRRRPPETGEKREGGKKGKTVLISPVSTPADVLTSIDIKRTEEGGGERETPGTPPFPPPSPSHTGTPLRIMGKKKKREGEEKERKEKPSSPPPHYRFLSVEDEDKQGGGREKEEGGGDRPVWVFCLSLSTRVLADLGATGRRREKEEEGGEKGKEKKKGCRHDVG